MTALFISELKLVEMTGLLKSRLCDVEIELGAPSPLERGVILKSYLEDVGVKDLSGEEIDELV